MFFCRLQVDHYVVGLDVPMNYSFLVTETHSQAGALENMPDPLLAQIITVLIHQIVHRLVHSFHHEAYGVFFVEEIFELNNMRMGQTLQKGRFPAYSSYALLPVYFVQLDYFYGNEALSFLAGGLAHARISSFSQKFASNFVKVTESSSRLTCGFVACLLEYICLSYGITSIATSLL